MLYSMTWLSCILKIIYPTQIFYLPHTNILFTPHKYLFYPTQVSKSLCTIVPPFMKFCSFSFYLWLFAILEPIPVIFNSQNFLFFSQHTFHFLICSYLLVLSRTYRYRVPYDNNELIKITQESSVGDISLKNILAASAARNRKWRHQFDFLCINFLSRISWYRNIIMWLCNDIVIKQDYFTTILSIRCEPIMWYSLSFSFTELFFA